MLLRSALSLAAQRRVVVMPSVSLDTVTRNLQQVSFTTITQPVSNKHASVLIPLFEDDEGNVQVVLTERSSKLPTHSGEVCLPGGKREPSDPDDIATALREANEELGIDPETVRVVGKLPCVLSKHLLSVTPVVGVIPPHLEFSPNASEVASVFTAPLHMFIESGPGYSSRDSEFVKGMPYRLHYFRYKHLEQEYVIWGLTAGILIAAAEKAFGCKAAFEVHPPGARPYSEVQWDGAHLHYRPAPATPVAVRASGERLPVHGSLQAALAQHPHDLDAAAGTLRQQQQRQPQQRQATEGGGLHLTDGSSESLRDDGEQGVAVTL